MKRDELGSWLRRQRETRCWSRPEMARQLIKAAHVANDRSMTDVDNLCHNIYRWEKGTVKPSERYKLYYCRALSIPATEFGRADSAKAGALALPRECSGETVKLLNLMELEHGVSLRAESTTAAVRIARELSEGMTQAGRIATHEFLIEIARAVRWPGLQNASDGYVRLAEAYAKTHDMVCGQRRSPADRVRHLACEVLEQLGFTRFTVARKL